MNLKNLMEDKKLDFNQPLLSVRRVSSTAVYSQAENKRKTDNSLPKIPPLPIYKSELKSGPVSNPGTVPFNWEKTPGKPKDERKAQNLTREQPRIGPKLPPGRVPNVKQQDWDKGSKAMTITQYKPENFLPKSQNISSLDKNVNKCESSKEKMEVKEGSGSEDGDEAYLDALDTISRSESFSMNCSISGLSSLDAPDGKPSGTFSMDPQTRDFMMGRFLPAAKAMASETPQHAAWKQPRPVEKLVTMDKCGPLSQDRPNVVPHHTHDVGGKESEDEADDYDENEISSARVCGFFPRFCFKNSLCLMNPVPGMSMQTGVRVSSVRRVKAKSLYSGSCNEPVKEHAGDAVMQRSLDGHATAEQHEEKIEVKRISNQTTYKSDCGKSDESSLKRHLQGNGVSACQSESCHSLHEEKGFLGFTDKAKNSRVNASDLDRKGGKIFQELLAHESAEWESGSISPVVEKTLYIDSVHTVKSRNSNSSSPDMRGLTDYREDDFRIPVKSSEMEKIPSVLDSSFQDLKPLSAVDEKAKVRHENLESVDACFLSCSDSSNHDIQMEMVNDSKQDQDQDQDQDLALNSIQMTSPKAVDTKTFDSEIQQPLKSGDSEGTHCLTQDSSTLTSSKVADSGKIGLEKRRPKKSCTQESSGGLIKDSVTFASLKVGEKIDLENQRRKTLGKQEISHGNYPHLPLGPPLPKSPSESWLKRTLPTISSRNLPSRSSLGMQNNTRNPASKTNCPDSNWETIVKTSNVRQGHLRFSEELLTPIPEA